MAIGDWDLVEVDVESWGVTEFDKLNVAVSAHNGFLCGKPKRTDLQNILNASCEWDMRLDYTTFRCFQRVQDLGAFLTGATGDTWYQLWMWYFLVEWYMELYKCIDGTVRRIYYSPWIKEKASDFRYILKDNQQQFWRKVGGEWKMHMNIYDDEISTAGSLVWGVGARYVQRPGRIGYIKFREV